jgi:hypothetical protein
LLASRSISGVGRPGVLDDLSRRVGVLANRIAAASSSVGVVYHDAAEYQSGAAEEAPEDP